MKKLAMAVLVFWLASCETIEKWDLFPKPARPVDYRRVLEPDHPLRLALDSFYPPARSETVVYDPSKSYSVAGPNGSSVDLPVDALAVVPGQKVTIRLTQATSALEVLACGQTLWYDDRTVFETNGMIRLSITDESGRPVATKPGQAAKLSFPEGDNRPGVQLYDMTPGGWRSQGSQSAFLENPSVSYDPVTYKPGFYRVGGDGSMKPAPLLFYGQLRKLFDQLYPDQASGPFHVQYLQYSSGSSVKTLENSEGSYLFFRYPGRQARNLTWTVSVTNPFKPTPEEQKVLDAERRRLEDENRRAQEAARKLWDAERRRLEAENDRIAAAERLKFEADRAAAAQDRLRRANERRVLDQISLAAPNDYPWWNCDLASRYNILFARSEEVLGMLGIQRQIVMIFVFLESSNTVWNQDQDGRIPVSRDIPMTLLFTDKERKVFQIKHVRLSPDGKGFTVGGGEGELTAEELMDPGLFAQTVGVGPGTAYSIKR